MPVKSATFHRLLNSAGITLNVPDTTSANESDLEPLDLIDQMHDLAKLGHTPWTISELLDVPYKNVRYWYDVNGYSD